VCLCGFKYKKNEKPLDASTSQRNSDSDSEHEHEHEHELIIEWAESQATYVAITIASSAMRVYKP
jgi:hypothetical protein